MIKSKRHIILLSLTGILMFAGMYLFLRASVSDFVQVNISTKTLRNAESKLLYDVHGNNDSPALRTERHTLLASQFYKNYSYYVTDFQEVNSLRFKPAEAANTIFIEKISFVHHVNSMLDTLFEWLPRDSLQALFTDFENVTINSHTPKNLQVSTSDSQSVLRMDFSKVLKHYDGKSHIIQEIKLITGAILITLFFLLTILGAPAVPSRMVFRLKWSVYNLLVYAFFAVLLFTFANSVFRFVPDMPNRENRTLSKLPVLKPKSFFTYPEQFSTYADEHYSMRNRSYFINSVLHAKLLHESVLPDKVIMGNYFWMYYNEEGSISDLRRLTKVDSAEINNVISIMRNRIDWLEARNIKYYIIVPPNKERIYPEFLPASYFPLNNYGHNRLDYYKKMLREHTKAVFVDPTDSLYVAKLRKDVYYHSDTHWNLYGGFIGYLCLMNELVKDFPAIRPLKEDDFIINESFTEEGDLSSMLALQKVYKRKEYLFTFKDSSKKILPNLPSEIVLHYAGNKTLDSSNLKLVMFRDSYANYLIPFINLHFKKATYIWNYEFMSEVIEQQKPDVVIFESLERFMAYALTIPNTPSMDAEAAQKYRLATP